MNESWENKLKKKAVCMNDNAAFDNILDITQR